MDNTQTFTTLHGKITLYKNEVYIGNEFKRGSYWDIGTLMNLKKHINPNKNILEVGGHVGTSSIVYSSFLQSEKKVFVYEPQLNIYNLLVHNINQNNRQMQIVPFNLGVFCFKGHAKMNNIDLDGGMGIVSKRYNEESNLECNFGGIGLGSSGEDIQLTTIDDMEIDNIGFIHCDAQGAENFIFSKGLNAINKFHPLILYEDNEEHAKYLYDNVCNSYPSFKEESIFNIKQYCVAKLGYSYIDKFNGSIDCLLIPPRHPVLVKGREIRKRSVLQSHNCKYTFTLQDDGNLVLFEGSNVLWASHTGGRSTTHFILQHDGNLVLFDNISCVWASGTYGQSTTHLIMQDDGNLVLYNDNTPIWATHTNQ
jgi:FkbM family methyltransferase